MPHSVFGLPLPFYVTSGNVKIHETVVLCQKLLFVTVIKVLISRASSYNRIRNFSRIACRTLRLVTAVVVVSAVTFWSCCLVLWVSISGVMF